MVKKRNSLPLLMAGTLLLLALACQPTKEEEAIANTIVAAAATPTSPPEVGALPVDADAPFGAFCGRIAVTEEQYAALPDSAIQPDEADDLFDPRTGQSATDPPPASDVLHTLETTATLSGEEAAWLSNEVFPCDNVSTYCGNAGPIPAGDVYFLGTEMAGSVPLICPQVPCEYAVAVANLENFVPEVELDLFRGTRWWYILSDYGEGFHVVRVDSAVGRSAPATEARVTVIDDEVVWIIPTAEMTMPTGIRLTAYTPGGADVDGALPTDPLMPVPSGGLLVGEGADAYYPFAAGQKIVLPGDYNLLGASCQPPADRGGNVWCLPTEDCTLSLCECHLFSRAAGDPPQEWGSWRHEAGEAGSGGQMKMLKDLARRYHCFCVY